MHADLYTGPMGGLPDPELDRAFYEWLPFKRLVAWCLDLVVVLAIGLPVALAFGVFTLGFGFVLFPVVLATIAFLYRTATLAGGSATWGMRLLGIEFRRGDGSRFDGLTALLHTAIQTIAFGFFFLQMLSCVAVVASRYRQSLPDIILGTTAINQPAD